MKYQETTLENITVEGLYLYGIRERTPNAPAFSAKGIDGKGGVFTVACRNLETIVCKVSLEEYGSDEIRRRAQEDLKWIKEKALAHQSVLAEAMTQGERTISLIPMRFGVIFKEQAGLEATLAKRYVKYQSVLSYLRGKQEWSLKAYLVDRNKLEQEVKENNEVIRKKAKEIAAAPEGLAFFLEEELNALIIEGLDKELTIIVDALFNRFKKYASAAAENKLLRKEVTGRTEPMVLNAAYLIPEENVPGFRIELREVDTLLSAKGLFLEESGPWAAFNFASDEPTN